MCFRHRTQTVQTAGHQIESRHHPERRRVLRLSGRGQSRRQNEGAGQDRAQRGQALSGAVPRRGLPVSGAVRLLAGERVGAQAVRHRSEYGGRVYVR